MLVIALIVGFVVILVVVQRVVGSTVQGADRAIRHKRYESNVAQAETRLILHAPVPPSELIARIITMVNAQESVPAVFTALYIKASTEFSVTFALGNKTTGDHFVAQLALRVTTDESDGWFKVLRWQESGAEVHGRPEMIRLRELITEAVTNLEGTIRSA